MRLSGQISSSAGIKAMGKLTATSPARMLLVSKFLSGEITGEEDPKSVWESDPVFKAHKLANFRVHYNDLRKNPPIGSMLNYFLRDKTKTKY